MFETLSKNVSLEFSFLHLFIYFFQRICLLYWQLFVYFFSCCQLFVYLLTAVCLQYNSCLFTSWQLMSILFLFWFVKIRSILPKLAPLALLSNETFLVIFKHCYFSKVVQPQSSQSLFHAKVSSRLLFWSSWMRILDESLIIPFWSAWQSEAWLESGHFNDPYFWSPRAC